MYATLKMSGPDLTIETPAGLTFYPATPHGFGLAMAQAAELFAEKPWPVSPRETPPKTANPLETKPAARKAKATKPAKRAKRRARKIPADRSAKPDTSPDPRKVWRAVAVSASGSRREFSHRSRKAARIRVWTQLVTTTKPGDTIRVKSSEIVNRARKATNAAIKPATAKKTKANRSAKIRRQRAANEVRAIENSRNAA